METVSYIGLWSDLHEIRFLFQTKCSEWFIVQYWINCIWTLCGSAFSLGDRGRCYMVIFHGLLDSQLGQFFINDISTFEDSNGFLNSNRRCCLNNRKNSFVKFQTSLWAPLKCVKIQWISWIFNTQKTIPRATIF